MLLKPCAFLFIMFYAYFLKKRGLFDNKLPLIIMKIVMNCTLPCSIIVAFSGFKVKPSLIILAVIALAVSTGAYLLMFILTKNLDREKRVYYMISVSGYNIGCFGLPIIDTIYSGVGAVISAMFDLGNSVMMSSGNYALTNALLPSDKQTSHPGGKEILKNFFKSMPVCVNLIMFFLSLLGFALPDAAVEFVRPIASANPFLSMFMLGLFLVPPSDKEDIKSAAIVVLFRMILSGSLALLLFQVLPFTAEIKIITALCLLCPMGSLGPGFIERCGGDGKLAAFTNSVSTIVSLLVMIAVVYSLK